MFSVKSFSVNLVSEKLVSEKTSDVVDAYEHALLGKFPRARYVVGKDARLLIPMHKLPEWLVDWIQHKLNNKRPVPAILKN